jgi:hypothetical protein
MRAGYLNVIPTKIMIFIEEKEFERQLDLLVYFMSRGEFDLIIWLFPESKLRNICGLKLAPQDLFEGEQVTKYGDGFKPKKTRRVELTLDLLNEFRNSATEIQLNCDSLALYPPSERSWSICTIEHGGMCLARDENLMDELLSHGFNASLKKPEWW